MWAYHVSAIARNLHAICSDILRRLKHTKIGFEFVLEKKKKKKEKAKRLIFDNLDCYKLCKRKSNWRHFQAIIFLENGKNSNISKNPEISINNK